MKTLALRYIIIDGRASTITTIATMASPSPTPDVSTQNRRPTILLLGDSLTQLSFEGWGATLANVYQRRCDVLNRGYAGYNTTFYLRHVLPHLLRDDLSEGSNAKLCVVFFGANDAALREVDPHHHVPIDEYADNLKRMITQIQQSASRPKILLVTPPTVHHEQRLQYQKQRFGDKATGVLERRNDVTAQYADACAALGAAMNVPVLHMFNAMVNGTPNSNSSSINAADETAWGEYFYDGLHFSSAGQQFVATQVLHAINEHFPDLAVVPDPVTGQWCNSGSQCPALSPNGPYHDEIS
jgi:isoamyl acetate esterase